MTDMRSRLRQASEHMRPPERAFERMVERRDRKRRTERVASAAIALAVAVAAIGGAVVVLSGLAPDRVQPGSGGTSRGVDPSPQPYEWDQARISEENLKVREYVSCMRDRGWELPEPTPWEGPPHPGLLDPPHAVPGDPEAADQYFGDSADCGVPYEGDREGRLPAGENGDREFDQARISEENRKVREYVACMRDRGWELPEPTPWEGPPHPGLLDPPHAVPGDPEAADQYFGDSADCGVPFYDKQGNLLPLGE